MDLGKAIKKLGKVREKIKSLQRKEAALKASIHARMNELYINRYEHNDYVCIRKIKACTVLTKNDVPINVWKVYGRRRECPVLLVKRKMS